MGDEDYSGYGPEYDAPTLIDRGFTGQSWDSPMQQQDRNWYTQNLPRGWTTNDYGTIVPDQPFQAAPLSNAERWGGDLNLYQFGGGGVPYRDQQGNLLSDPMNSTLVVQNPDGSWTNRPTTHGGTLYQGSPADYGIPGPGMSGGNPNLPTGSMGAGQNQLYRTGASAPTGGGGGGSSGGGGGAYNNTPSFSPMWNLADSLEARNRRMETAPPDIFDQFHNYKSPSVTTLAPSQSGAGLPGRGGTGTGTGTGEGTTRVTTQSNIMPATAMPTFVRPEVDQAKIESRIQEIMAPATSSLKRTIREAIARRRFSSPTLEKFALQGAVEGYGNALGDVQSKARQAGRSSYYAEDWQPKWQEAMTNYNAQLNNWMSQIQRQTVTESY